MPFFTPDEKEHMKKNGISLCSSCWYEPIGGAVYCRKGLAARSHAWTYECQGWRDKAEMERRIEAARRSPDQLSLFGDA